MYKLHYDVDPGEQINVVYKGMDIEVQAGEGEDVAIEANKEVTITENGTVEITPSIDNDAMAKVTATVNVPLPLENAKFISNQNVLLIPAYKSGTYLCFGSTNGKLVYQNESVESGCRIIVSSSGSGFPVNTEVPVFAYNSPLEYLELQNVTFTGGGDQSAHPIKECVVRGNATISGNLGIGTQSSTRAQYKVYGKFTLNGDLMLNGCDLYLYSNQIIAINKSITDGTGGGSVHVLTTYSSNTVGNHSVIKDLTL